MRCLRVSDRAASRPLCSAKNIKNVAKRNEDVNQQVISQLRDEIEALRKQLAMAQTTGTAGGAAGGDTHAFSEAKRAEMEELLAVLDAAKQQARVHEGRGHFPHSPRGSSTSALETCMLFRSLRRASRTSSASRSCTRRSASATSRTRTRSEP